MHLVGGRAFAAQEYPVELCRSICRGLAAQKKYDLEYRLSSPAMSTMSLVDFSRSCCQATSKSKEIEESLKPAWNAMSSLCNVKRYSKSVWRAPVIVPKGEYPSHWHDGVPDLDGHGMHDDAAVITGEDILRSELSALYVNEGVMQAVDDVSGSFLDPALVSDARALEMKFFKDMRVYDRVPSSEMIKRRGKIIKTRWIDVNKGDAEKPNYRSRLVGK